MTGTPIDPSPFTIGNTGGSYSDTHSAASNGESYLVAWKDEDAQQIFVRSIRPDGTLSAPLAMPLVESGARHSPTVASAGGDYLVGWRLAQPDIDRIIGVRIVVRGNALEPTWTEPWKTLATGRLGAPELASDGSRYLLVWPDHRRTTHVSGPVGGIPPGEVHSDIYGALVAADGTTVSNPAGFALAVTNDMALEPSVAAAPGPGGTFALSYRHYRGDRRAYFVFVHSDLSATEPLSLDDLPAAQASSALTYVGGQFLVGYGAKDGTANRAIVRRYNPTLPPATRLSGRILLSGAASAGPESPPSIAGSRTGTIALAAWPSVRWNARQIRGALVGATVSEPVWISPDVKAPTATIESRPSDVTSATSATFTFSADEDGVEFTCAVDGEAEVPCTSPTSYGPMTEGRHSFAVRARDAAGNVQSSPTTWSWTVDLTSPTTTITMKPDPLVNSTTATFSFASEPGATFACSLDGEAYKPCFSPARYTGLSEGSHTFGVRATDPAGNSETPGPSAAWVIDTTPPDTTITSAPSSPRSSNTATVEFTSEPGSRFVCRLNSNGYSPCNSPTTYSGLPDGQHVFRVAAVDAAGNIDSTPATAQWVTDTAPPKTTITTRPSSDSSSRSAAFTFQSEPGATFECALDTASFAQCVSPVSYTNLSEGPHDFRVRATDGAGNMESPPAGWSWIVDVTPPETTIQDRPAPVTPTNSVRFTFSGEEGATFSCSLDGRAFVACTSPMRYTDLAEGEHTFAVRGRDAAGNVDPTPATWTWVVDAKGPSVKFLRPAPGVYANDQRVSGTSPYPVALGAMSIETEVTDRESGVASVAFKVDGVPISSSLVTCSTVTDGVRCSFTHRGRGRNVVTATGLNGSGHVESSSVVIYGVG